MKTIDPMRSLYDGKHVLVLGLGESGLAMARWLLRCGARVRVADTREAPPALADLRALAPQAQWIAGAFDAALLEGIDLLAVSPGLSPLHELAAIGAAAEQNGVPIVGEIELFAQALAALRTARGYAPKRIAVTGTNGKTTVTRLVGLLCERSGLRVQVAGNISPAALEVLRTVLEQEDAAQEQEALAVVEQAKATMPPPAASSADSSADADAAIAQQADAALPEQADAAAPQRDAAAAQVRGSALLPQVWVLELSSFQLHHTFTLAPDAATVLNISQDHLDWHGDLDAYIDAKAQIFGKDTVRVLNRDDAAVMQLDAPHARTITFGADEARIVDCFGLVADNGMQWLSLATPASDDGQKRRKKSEQSAAPILTTRLMPADALKIRGRHNALNALAALALCRAIGLPLAPLLHGLRDYEGEPHRVELIATIGDVAYYDDSKGTNVGASVAALVGLGVQPSMQHADGARRIWLIAGGEGKGQDFTPLADPVRRYARAVLLIGRDAALLRNALSGSGCELIDCATLEAAVALAAERAEASEIVLLSPACASFDMFRGYAHRAAVFVEAVREIASNRGEVLA